MPILRCIICKKEMYVKPSHLLLGWGKFCSTRCRSLAQKTGQRVECFRCGSQIYRSVSAFHRSKSGKFFCSKSCQTEWKNTKKSAEKHPNWLGGIRSYRNILLRTKREQKCAGCGTTDIRVLVVHHLDRNRLNNVPSNLIWTCLNCHFLIHHYKNFEYRVK